MVTEEHGKNFSFAKSFCFFPCGVSVAFCQIRGKAGFHYQDASKVAYRRPRRSTFPGRADVNRPASTTGIPFTMTYGIPSA